MGKIIIGKNALESLTSGMYADSFDIFREYIQNAVDSIDNAYRSRILFPEQELVTISLNSTAGSIEINDNGLGIASNEAEQILTCIGCSRKDISLSRGFRGIGRLSALSYCQSLIFETSFPGEECASRLTIDALKISEMLSLQNETPTLQAESVMESACSFEQFKVARGQHYFRVIMKGIDNNSNLLNPNLVLEYLRQIAPVPFNPVEFIWGKEIVKRIQQCGYNIPHYRIHLIASDKTYEITKPYSDKFLVDKARNIYDSIKDISIKELYDNDNNNNQQPIAIIWIAKTNFVGTVVDKKVKGLRIRKGNILIGDHHTLNSVFKDSRLNGWNIGEVYVLNNKLLPNARRDNFENSPSLKIFIEKMTEFASNFTVQIKQSALACNPLISSVIERAESISAIANNALSEANVQPTEIEYITDKLHSLKKELDTFETKESSEKLFHEIAFDQMDIIIGKVQGASKFKSINILRNLSKTEKIILGRVFFVLENILSESEMQRVCQAILEDFSKHTSS